MKDFQFHAAGKTVRFSADVTADTAQWFEQILTEQDKAFGIIGDKKLIQILALHFCFSKESDGWRVLAADYAGDPSRNAVSDLTLALQLLGQQQYVLQKTGLAPQDAVSLLDTVLIRRSALLTQDVYLMKQELKEKTDSGLYLGALSNRGSTADPEDYTAMPLFRLLMTHPAVLSAVCLPAGSIAVIRNNAVAGICGPDGTEVFRRPGD